jgi:hypothetical protein
VPGTRARSTIRTGTATLGVIALVAAVTVTTSAGSALAGSKGANVPTYDRAKVAAGYLARHLQGKNNDHYTLVFSGVTYANFGQTADAVLSMDAAGASQAAAGRATDYLAAHVNDYAAGSPTYYPGAVAKLVLVALAQHRDVHDFGGVDLVDVLAASEGADGAASGEFQQNPGFPGGDSYIVSQALPVLALAAAADAAGQPDDAAVSFLIDQQCANGGYASLIRDDTSTDCTDNDVDATGYAVQALLAAGAKSDAAEGLDWLGQAQHDSGGFGTTATAASNANSTALAAQALIAGHRDATGALRWLRHHQVLCAGKAGRRGAVTFQKTYDANALRATSQAGAALAGKPLAWIDRAGSSGADSVYATC